MVAPVSDDYHVALLDDELYYPDGQIKGPGGAAPHSECHDHRVEHHLSKQRERWVPRLSMEHTVQRRGRAPAS